MPNNENNVVLDLFDENGNLISKEEFLENTMEFYDSIAKFYDSVAEEIKETKQMSKYLARLSDPETQVDIEGIIETYDFTERSIFITSEITTDYSSFILRELLLWNKADDEDNIPLESRTPIKIYIDTPGGDLDATLSIIDLIKASKTPVHTYVTGTAFSGGFFIGISGHKRFAFPHSSFCFHEGSGVIGGDAHKIIQHTDHYKKQLKQLKQIVLENTKISSEDYDEHIKDDWYILSDTALRYGIIDEVITKL